MSIVIKCEVLGLKCIIFHLNKMEVTTFNYSFK